VENSTFKTEYNGMAEVTLQRTSYGLRLLIINRSVCNKSYRFAVRKSSNIVLEEKRLKPRELSTRFIAAHLPVFCTAHRFVSRYKGTVSL